MNRETEAMPLSVQMANRISLLHFVRGEVRVGTPEREADLAARRIISKIDQTRSEELAKLNEKANELGRN